MNKAIHSRDWGDSVPIVIELRYVHQFILRKLDYPASCKPQPEIVSIHEFPLLLPLPRARTYIRTGTRSIPARLHELRQGKRIRIRKLVRLSSAHVSRACEWVPLHRTMSKPSSTYQRSTSSLKAKNCSVLLAYFSLWYLLPWPGERDMRPPESESK